MSRVHQDQGDRRSPLRHDSTSGERVLALATHAYGAALGHRLTAVYALGSLAHGGFCPAVSDVDLAVVIDERRTGDDRLIDRVQREIRTSGVDLASRLSVCWSSVGALRDGGEDGRFPAADRVDLLDHGRLLLGRDVRPVPRPSRAELTISGARFALARLGDDRTIAEIRQPELLAADPVRFTKVVLMPVRLCYTQATGELGFTDAAVRHHLADGATPARQLVCFAQALRHGLLSDPGAALDVARRELSSLHTYYIDVQLPHLEQLGPSARETAAALARWRRALRPGRSAVGSTPATDGVTP